MANPPPGLASRVLEAGSGFNLPETPAAEGGHPPNFSAPKILLPDDNADMRFYLRELLTPFYSVESAADGEEALVSIRRQRPNGR